MWFLIMFLLSWTAWLLLADKKRWRELLPVGLFLGFLGASTDHMMQEYQLWGYTVSTMSPWLIQLTVDWGVYTVVPYLFIQWLPKHRTPWNMLKYWFIWTGIAILIEWLHLKANLMGHYKWWNIGYSYAADWFLLWLAYQFHKTFRFELLSKNNKSK